MDNDAVKNLRAAIMNLWKVILELDAGQAATRHVLLAIEKSPHVPDDVKKIIRDYPSFYDQEREKTLFRFEEMQPGLAAELDESGGHNPPQHWQAALVSIVFS